MRIKFIQSDVLKYNLKVTIIKALWVEGDDRNLANFNIDIIYDVCILQIGGLIFLQQSWVWSDFISIGKVGINIFFL